MNVNDKLEIILRRTVDVISEEDLTEKLKESDKTGKPLNVKAGFDPQGILNPARMYEGI